MTPADLKALPRPKFFYECSEGHGLSAPTAQTACRARPNGKDCTGKLRRLK